MNPWLCNLLFNNSGGSSLPATGQTFYASLKTSLVPEVCTGGPSWSRATAAWRFNDIGYLQQIPSGCAEFGGARLVTNTVRTKSEDFNNAAWAKVSLTAPSANTILCANATSVQSLSQNATAGAVIIGQIFIYCIRAQYVTGGVSYLQITANDTGFGLEQYLNVSLVDGSFRAVGCTGSVTIVSTGVYDIYIKVTSVTSGNYDGFSIALINSLSDTRFPFFVGDGVKSVNLLRAWSVDVTGRDASYIPEYVSVGVLYAPYHGAGVDKSKYFATDGQGAPIPVANLTRLRKESSATNVLLWSRDLSNAAWSTKTNITAAKTATGLDGIANSASTLTATSADAIILQPTSGIASAARCASAYVERVAGTGTISFTQDGGSTWTDITSQLNSSTYSRVQITATLANPSVGFKISTSGDAIAVDCVQNEAGAVATSPIVTTTTTVNRNADVLTYQTAGNIDATVGSCYVMYSAYEEVSTFHRAIIGLSITAVTANALLYNASSVATTSLYSGDGTTSINKAGLLSAANTPRKRAISWGGSTRLMTGDGVSSTSGAFSGTLPSTEIGICGYTNGTLTISGRIGDVAIYNYKMTDAELQAITT